MTPKDIALEQETINFLRDNPRHGKIEITYRAPFTNDIIKTETVVRYDAAFSSFVILEGVENGDKVWPPHRWSFLELLIEMENNQTIWMQDTENWKEL